MQNVSIQKARDLLPAMKSAVEQLLGRPIDADEEISVVAIPTAAVSVFREFAPELRQSLKAS
jgi:hypothetical protein